MRGKLSMEEFVMGGENFHEEGEGFFLVFFLKNNEKINMKKVLSTKSKEQH